MASIVARLQRQLRRIPFHVRYLSYCAGRSLKLGGTHFRMKGYFPNRFYAGDTFEPYLFAVLERLLSFRKGTFIDVGTNAGQTLTKVLAVDPARAYIGFEPQIACCFYIDQFIRINEIRSAQIIPLGLGEVTEFLPFFIAGDLDEMASMDRGTIDSERDAHFVRLPVMNGDEAIDKLSLDEIAVIKIDVEGAELSVLRGLSGTLSKRKPALLFEVLPNFVGEERAPVAPALASIRCERADEIFELLTGVGYSILQISPTGALLPMQSFLLNHGENYNGRDYLALQTAELPLLQLEAQFATTHTC